MDKGKNKKEEKEKKGEIAHKYDHCEEISSFLGT